MATTSTALTGTPAASRSHRPRGALAQAARVFARDRQAMLGLLIIAIIGGAALAAPLISPWDPLTSASVERLSPVGTPGHLLGTDEQGRDILSRLIWGGRAALLVGILPTVTAGVVALGLGLLAGYLGGLVDHVIMRALDVFFAFPFDSNDAEVRQGRSAVQWMAHQGVLHCCDGLNYHGRCNSLHGIGAASVRRFLLMVFLLGSLAVLAAGGWALWWVYQPLQLNAPSIDLSIEPGTLPRGVAQAVKDAGVDVEPELLYLWFRFSGQDRQIKAGSYELEAGITPYRLLAKLARGEESLRAVTLVEGWTFRQFRAALSQEDVLKPETHGMTDEAVMTLLGRPAQHPEGRFFPDTYTYAKGTSDVAVLKRAMRAMDKRLAAAWEQRTPEVAVKTPDEALILASIIEKETGKAGDRPLVAAVFSNRLRVGMPLQTDPTVIYGMGRSFDGNIRKKDLQKDTPWNTYTRPGLPPTPIAMPGKASLLAAVHPAPSKALYFVGRGDGTSQFSANLDEHNRAVNKYQRGQ